MGEKGKIQVAVVLQAEENEVKCIWTKKRKLPWSYGVIATSKYAIQNYATYEHKWIVVILKTVILTINLKNFCSLTQIQVKLMNRTIVINEEYLDLVRLSCARVRLVSKSNCILYPLVGSLPTQMSILFFMNSRSWLEPDLMRSIKKWRWKSLKKFLR